VLCAAAMLFMLWQENDAAQHCMASFFVLQQEIMCCSIVWHSATLFLFMPWQE